MLRGYARHPLSMAIVFFWCHAVDVQTAQSFRQLARDLQGESALHSGAGKFLLHGSACEVNATD
ncbi:MAG: hypothetical protein ACI9TH_001153 [Kiritimatiellia bacterium]|jgi:hypothetical protein